MKILIQAKEEKIKNTEQGILNNEGAGIANFKKAKGLPTFQRLATLNSEQEFRIMK